MGVSGSCREPKTRREDWVPHDTLQIMYEIVQDFADEGVLKLQKMGSQYRLSLGSHVKQSDRICTALYLLEYELKD